MILMKRSPGIYNLNALMHGSDDKEIKVKKFTLIYSNETSESTSNLDSEYMSEIEDSDDLYSYHSIDID